MKRKTHKNQLISYIHALSGKSYKEARQICKAAKWNESAALITVLNFDKCEDVFTSFYNAFGQTINEMGEAIQKMMNSLGTTAREIKDSMRQAGENMIQNDR